MNEITLARESLQLLRKDMMLTADTEAINEDDPFEWLTDLVVMRVDELLNQDLAGFLNLLYRIDISEGVTREILAQDNPDKIPLLFAKAIIDRQKQKLITRRRYQHA